MHFVLQTPIDRADTSTRENERILRSSYGKSALPTHLTRSTAPAVDKIAMARLFCDADRHRPAAVLTVLTNVLEEP